MIFLLGVLIMQAQNTPSMGQRHGIVDDFIARGHHQFESGVDPLAAARLLTKIRQSRTFNEDLFLSEAEFDANPQYVGVNPAHPTLCGRCDSNLHGKGESRLFA